MKRKHMTKKMSVTVALVLGMIFSGCKRTDETQAAIAALRAQLSPLQVRNSDGSVKTISFEQALHWHETRESDHAEAEDDHHAAESHPICLGVLAGYQAIRYACDQLFPEESAAADDFEIEVSGPMNGVRDILALYTGKETDFKGAPGPISRNSFTFTAWKLSTNQSVVFRLREGLIPNLFYELKNEGAACGHPQLGKMKQQTILNLLSVPAGDCFERLENAAFSNR